MRETNGNGIYYGSVLRQILEHQHPARRRTSAPVMWADADPIGRWERLWERNEGLALFLTWAATLLWGAFCGVIAALWITTPTHGADGQYVFTAPSAIMDVGDTATLPLTLTETLGADSIDLTITYDPEAIAILSVTRGPAAPTYTVYSNIQADQSRVLVAMYSIDYPPPGSGAILNLTIVALGPPGTVSPIRITRHWINENWVPSEAVDGSIWIPRRTWTTPGYKSPERERAWWGWVE